MKHFIPSCIPSTMSWIIDTVGLAFKGYICYSIYSYLTALSEQPTVNKGPQNNKSDGIDHQAIISQVHNMTTSDRFCSTAAETGNLLFYVAMGVKLASSSHVDHNEMINALIRMPIAIVISAAVQDALGSLQDEGYIKVYSNDPGQGSNLSSEVSSVIIRDNNHHTYINIISKVILKSCGYND